MKEFFAKQKWPLIIAAAAVLIRLIYLLELSGQAGFSVPMVDEKWHWLWAQEIIDGSFWGESAYFRGPLYPYFLALLHLLTGGSIFWAKFLQILLCGGTAFFIFRIAEHLFNRKVAIVSGTIYAIYGTLVFYESMFLIPVLFLFLTVWGMYRLVVFQDSQSKKRWLLTGLIFGLAAIARPNILLVIPFLALWLYFRHRTSADLKMSALSSMLMYLLGVIIAIAPVTIRNIAVTGDLILISSQGGINLHLGNNEYADGLTMIMPEIELNQSITWDRFIPATTSVAEREVGHSLSAADASSFWMGRALGFIVSNPGKFLELVWKKSVYLISGFENSDATDIYYQRRKSVLYSFLLWDKKISFPFGVLLPLAIIGVVILSKDSQKLLPLYVFIVAYIPTIVLFLVTARHRLPLLPFLIIIAAAGMVRLWKSFKSLGPARLGTGGVLLVLLLLVFNTNFYDLGIPNPFQIHFNDGLTSYRLGDYEKAEREYLLADKVFPFSSALLVNLADVQIQIGKMDAADRNLTRALALSPQLAMVHNNLGLLVRGKGDIDSAVTLFRNAVSFHEPNMAHPNDIGEYFINLADTYEMSGDVDSASSAFLNAMSAAPEMPKAYYKAGAFFVRQKMYAISDSIYMKGQYVEIPSAVDLYNWGLSYMDRELYDNGIKSMLRALKKDPSFFRAYYVLAAVFNHLGEPKDTVDTYLNRCLEIEPGYEPAVQLKRELEQHR